MKPALDAEEWMAWTSSVSSQMPADDLLKVIARSNHLITDDSPHKIVRADVEALRRPMGDDDPDAWARIDVVAAKLAALLPPED